MSYNLLQIETTNVCNLHCPFCFREFMTREQGFMDFCTFRKSLRLAHDLKVKEIWLHNWGEPLLHPKLTKFIRHASRNFKVGFATNGTLLTFDKIREFKQNGLTFIDISLNMNSQKFNLVHIVAMYQIANEIGLDCRFRSVVSNNAEYKYLNAMFKTFKIRWQRAMIRNSKEVRTEKCLAKDKVCVILYSGEVIACCVDFNGILKYGRVNDKNIMNKINEGQKKIDECLPEFCQHCSEIDEKLPIKFKLGEE